MTGEIGHRARRGRAPRTALALLLTGGLLSLWGCTENRCSEDSVCGEKNSASQPTGPGATPGPTDGAIHATTTIGGQQGGADYYWPRSQAVLSDALAAGHALPSEPGIAQLDDTISITLQTDSAEAVLMRPVRVVHLRRRADPRSGLFARIPCGGCGGQSDIRYLATRLDDSAPVIVPSGSTSSGTYYYITAGSPEEFRISVGDQHCDCTFDLELDWIERGVDRSTLLSNGGRHFHTLGAADLPWYRDYNPGGSASVLVPQAAPVEAVPAGTRP